MLGRTQESPSLRRGGKARARGRLSPRLAWGLHRARRYLLSQEGSEEVWAQTESGNRARKSDTHHRGGTTTNKEHSRSFLSRVSQVASILGGFSHLANKWRQDGLLATTYAQVIKEMRRGSRGGLFSGRPVACFGKLPRILPWGRSRS